MDAETEAAIFAALRARPKRTTLILAHRRSTLSLADRVAVLDGGRVVDSGTVHELEARNALFRALLSGAEDETPEPDRATGTASKRCGRRRRPTPIRPRSGRPRRRRGRAGVAAAAVR